MFDPGSSDDRWLGIWFSYYMSIDGFSLFSPSIHDTRRQKNNEAMKKSYPEWKDDRPKEKKKPFSHLAPTFHDL